MVGREKRNKEHHFKSMDFIKSHTNSGLANTIKKGMNLIVSMNDAKRSKEREVRDVGDEDILHEPLLDDIDLEDANG